MSDATCPRCGGDNLTDYPVCDGCASVAHFTHRATCIHCERKRAAASNREEVLTLLHDLINTDQECQFIPCDTEAASALSGRLARLAGQAAQLLAKIEGGDE